MPWKWSERQQLPNLREARGVKGSQTALECHCRIGKTQNLRKLDAENEKVDTARFLRKCFGRQAPRVETCSSCKRGAVKNILSASSTLEVSAHIGGCALDSVSSTE